MRISNLPKQISAVCTAAILTCLLAADSADGQEGHVQAARASWTPTRSAANNHSTAATQRPQPKSTGTSAANRPHQRVAVRQASAVRPSGSAEAQGPIQLVSNDIPTPPPIDGGVYYETPMVSGSCDAIGGSCGCDAEGCDAMGMCGPQCGCSMCGELQSGRAWRPAITLSLPQDGWLSFEGIAMWTDSMDLPPLVTSAPIGTAQDEAGILGVPTTQVLFGGDGSDLYNDSRDAWRLNFGFWIDKCHTWGVGADYIEIDQQVEGISLTSTGNPILARPFFNTLTGREDAELVAFNDDNDIRLTGSIGVVTSSELAGGSFYVKRMQCCEEGCRPWLFCGCNDQYCSRADFRVGYRFMQLKEGVAIHEELQNNGGVNVGRFDITDGFNTENRFNGIDLGWSRRITRGYWTWDTLVRLAVGNTQQKVRIAGQSTITDLNDPNNVTTQTYNAGLLALSTNSGVHESDEFSVLPELNLTLGYQLTDHFKVTLGYTGIYWSNVVRPGQHIPTQINPDFLPPEVAGDGSPRPLFAFDTTDYWAQGLTYGLEFRW